VRDDRANDLSRLDPARLAGLLGPWRDGKGPLATGLAQRLITLIDRGVLAAGAQLPTERALATQLGLARATTTAAYRQVKQAGRLESRQGSGTRIRRVPGAPPGPRGTNDMFSTLGVTSPAGVIDLSLAETPCVAVTRAVLDTLGAGWLSSRVQGTGYHPQGLPELRAALVAHLGDDGIATDADHLVITTGAQQAIALAARVLCPPGSTVLVEEASYPGALEVFRRLGVRVLSVPTDDRGPDPEALGALATRTRPALVYLVPVGNNPTARTITAHRLAQLADVCHRHSLPVLEDRTPAPLADPDDSPAPLFARLPAGQVVVIGSMSKVAWAGIRTGWAISPTLTRELVAARIADDLSGSIVTQSVALALVPHLRAMAAEVRAELAISQAALADALQRELPEWSGRDPDACAWRWVRLPGDARRLAEAAASNGVLVTPVTVFSPDSRLIDHIRIAAVAPPEVLRAGVSRLRETWDALEQRGASVSRPHELLVV